LIVGGVSSIEATAAKIANVVIEKFCQQDERIEKLERMVKELQEHRK
jgi:hypothetical protein